MGCMLDVAGLKYTTVKLKVVNRFLVSRQVYIFFARVVCF